MFIGLIQVIGCLIPGKLTLLEKAFPNCIQPYIQVSWGQWARLLGALDLLRIKFATGRTSGSEASSWVLLEPVSLSHAHRLAWQNPTLS